MTSAPVGALRVTLGANTANFEQGMRRAAMTARRTGQDMERSYIRMTQSGVRAFSTLRANLGAMAAVLGGNMIFNAARGAVQWAAGLSETARQIGVTVQQLQILRLAAEQNGASVEGMERAMAILNRTLGQARAGLPAAVEAFRNVGISKEQLDNLRNAGDAFPLVAEGISRFASEAEQAAAAQRLFGRGAAELLPLLEQGRAGWDAATQAAIRNGLVTEEQARIADDASDQFSALGAALRVDLLNAVVEALPGLTALAQALGSVLSMVIRVAGWIGRLVSAIGDLARVRQLGGWLGGIQTIVNEQMPGVPGALAGGSIGGLGTMARGGGVRLDLSGGARPRGGGGRRNDEAARRRHQFDQEVIGLQIEELQARKENVEDLDERLRINEQISALEHRKWLNDQQFAVAQGEMTREQYQQVLALKRNVWTTEEIGRNLAHTRAGQELEAQIAEDQARAQEETLRSHVDLARTAEERRRLELELLELTYRNRRQALEELVRQRPGSDEARRADAALRDLPGRQAAERRGIMRSTMGPLESFMTTLPQTAAQIREALQSIAVDGLQSITDGLVAVMTGARKMGDVFRSVVTSIISDLLRIQLQRAIIGPLTNLLGGLMGGAGGGQLNNPFGAIFGNPFGGARAAGGPVLPGRTYLVGERGPELLRMGNMAGTVIANENVAGAISIQQTFKFDGVAVTKDELIQGLLATRSATLEAIRQGQRRRA